MTESEICTVAYFVIFLVGVVLILTVFNLIVLALSLKLYTEYFKERVKGKVQEAKPKLGDV